MTSTLGNRLTARLGRYCAIAIVAGFSVVAQARPAGAPAVGAVVSALPAGCVPETKSGVEYQKCGGVYFRSAFQGDNLVYGAQ